MNKFFVFVTVLCLFICTELDIDSPIEDPTSDTVLKSLEAGEGEASQRTMGRTIGPFRHGLFSITRSSHPSIGKHLDKHQHQVVSISRPPSHPGNLIPTVTVNRSNSAQGELAPAVSPLLPPSDPLHPYHTVSGRTHRTIVRNLSKTSYFFHGIPISMGNVDNGNGGTSSSSSESDDEEPVKRTIQLPGRKRFSIIKVKEEHHRPHRGSADNTSKQGIPLKKVPVPKNSSEPAFSVTVTPTDDSSTAATTPLKTFKIDEADDSTDDPAL